MNLEGMVRRRGSGLEVKHIAELLWELDSIGFEEIDLEAGPRLLAFFHCDADVERIRGSLRSLSPVRTSDITVDIHTVRYDTDRWVEEYSRTFTAFEVNPTFWIFPPWGERSAEHPVNILLEPGHGFGTGTHESTQLALVAMEGIAPEVGTMLDVGTGSGILSVAAAGLRPGLRIVALDIDPLAAEAAQETFERNGLEGVSLLVGELGSLHDRFELVLANLTSGILARLADDLAEKTERFLIVSGFTLDESDRVREVLERTQVLRCSEQWTKNGWACFLLRRCDES